jgi:S-adenosylmethionine:tRNA ribosyltransferase-isomerase
LDTADFDYLLPPECIAATPAAERDDARLLVMDRITGGRKHARFRDLLAHLPRRALLVLNDTRVFPARLRGRKPSGGAFELLLTRRVSGGARPDGFTETWEGLTRGLGSERAPRAFEVGRGVRVEIVDRRDGGRALLRATGPGPSLLAALEEIGEVPLPPYIEAARKRGASAGTVGPAVDDRARYQTVFADEPGAVAAPTAGLHFTPELLEAARAAGHEIARVTLHVGPGTFRPVEVADPQAHRMDAEHFRISPEAVEAIGRARAEGRRVVAVGTTVVRTLESAAEEGRVRAGSGASRLFIRPPYRFQVVDALLTNFHLPRSTLLMLVSAFAGREHVLAAYRAAVAERYRFFSYGDAMFIAAGAAR